MAKLDMNGPFAFDQETINQKVTKTSAGNYALGRLDEKGTFFVSYVGRSDTDVAERLSSHLNEKGYSFFKFSYASSTKDAFEKECRNYHDFGENKSLKNDYHPDKPNGTNYKCPVCNK
ncbi:MAG: hypothetical protein IKR09_09095 [Alphaproteobacteria bacterium]|nr:hypothetical protein [Alphaproteobacteria bacterium]